MVRRLGAVAAFFKRTQPLSPVTSAAIAGTSLTFTLYSDAGCTQQVHQQERPL